MKRRDRARSVFQRVLLVLSVIALVFRIAAPAGTMIADTGHGAVLVICTGHGAMTGMTASGKAPASKAHDNGSCEFAAAAAHALTADVQAPVGSSVWTVTSPVPPAGRPGIGSGLAAPPPPSQAPPVLSV